MNKAAIDLVVPNVKKLVMLDEMGKAIALLTKEIAPLFPSLEYQIIMLAGSQKELLDKQLSGVITDQEFRSQKAQLRQRILGILDLIPSEREVIKLTSSFRSLYTTTPKETLEKIQGPTNTLMSMSWIYEAIEVSKSVCQVIRADDTKGTGWLLEGGWMITNHHVIPNKQLAQTTKLVFDYEEDLHGSKRKTSEFRLDAETAIFSNLLKLDYAYIKVLDNIQNPLSKWGHLKLDTLQEPQKGDFVNIIQHPLGQYKQIALTRNDVIAVDKYKIFYRTDTEKGSSGAPVFDKNWNVIALHHLGKTEEEGGIIINEETGEKKGANEGILIKVIMEDIERQRAERKELEKSGTDN